MSKDTVSRWVKTFMTMAGIDATIFKTHSAHSAAKSAASRMGVTLETIMPTAEWSNAWTFATFYNKPLAENANFSSSLVVEQYRLYLSFSFYEIVK